MTVKHLQNIQKQQLAVAVASDPNVVQKFKTGFSECAAEVTRYISNLDGIESGVKQRLAHHLNSCVSGIPNPQNTMTFPLGQASTIPLTISQGNSGVSIQTGTPDDVNNNDNNRVQVPAGIQLIPSRLPTGELALLVPNSSSLPFFSNAPILNTYQEVQRNSAFTTVRPAKEYKLKMSPPLSPASSITSFEEHSPDSFSRPRTPSPKEITHSFPTPPTLFQNKETRSPPQQFQISSTSISPENKKEPLSVITVNYQNQNQRKRTHDGLLTVVPQPQTKQPRLSDEVIVISSSSSDDQNRPSTSHEGQNDNMWRPW